MEDCKNIPFDSGYLIYPFLWSAECDLHTAVKNSSFYGITWFIYGTFKKVRCLLIKMMFGKYIILQKNY